MKVVVIGLGSMGKRRIRLMQALDASIEIIGVDGREDRRQEAKELFGISTTEDLQTLVDAGVECAFVCTSPLSHNAIIHTCLEMGWNVFTELNLVSAGYEENVSLAKKKGCKLFLSSTFLYREETKYIREAIAGGEKWNYVYHIGQYLPDWHPWENFKEYFVGDKRTNGCRELLAIELPWLTMTFGEVQSFQVIKDKITDLPLDYNDNYMIQLTHANGNKGVLVVDVVSPCAVRRFEGYRENRYLQWCGTPESLLEYDPEKKELLPVALTEQAQHKEGYRTFIVENAYTNEIKEFFAYVKQNKEPIYGFEEDRRILQLINQLEA